MKSIMEKSLPVRIWRFYIGGFKNLSSWGKSLWIIILIKLFIILLIFRLLLMPDVLKKNFDTDEQRSKHVLENLTSTNL
jgi:hypothetical protein